MQVPAEIQPHMFFPFFHCILEIAFVVLPGGALQLPHLPGQPFFLLASLGSWVTRHPTPFLIGPFLSRVHVDMVFGFFLFVRFFASKFLRRVPTSGYYYPAFDFGFSPLQRPAAGFFFLLGFSRGQGRPPT